MSGSVDIQHREPRVLAVPSLERAWMVRQLRPSTPSCFEHNSAYEHGPTANAPVTRPPHQHPRLTTEQHGDMFST